MKQYKTQSKRILDLMVNSIYTNKEIFLRELISNASDAIDKLKFISLTDTSINSDFKIFLSIDKENKTLTIEDNGIGMNQEDLEKNLGTIAESGTLAFKKENEGKTDGELIGQFGVGFYSAFMVAKNIQVKTKKYGEEKAYLWQSSGAEGYSIEETTKDGFGSKITLTLKDDEEDYKYSDLLEQYKLISLVKKYSDYVRYPIEMLISRSKVKEGSSEDKPEYETIEEIQILNSMIPLWKKPKKDVTEENLAEFYKGEFHDYLEPAKSIYAKIEGVVNYDALLFVPKKAPYNFYSKDYVKGLKLYCNGVKIMDSCEELLPDYFGFIKGIIDSPDLSLNISREILQQDRQVKAIANGIEKKIISELNKLLEEDRQAYEEMFNEFGLSIKFGAYSNFGLNKDKLQSLLMFYSSKKQKLVTLAEYVKEMVEGQDEIYYACGSSYSAILNTPKVKSAMNKGYEVLLLKDDVDEFVVKVLGEVEGKKFKLVTESDFSFNSEEEKKQVEEKAEQVKDLLGELKEILKDSVKDVRLSADLVDYPVCLTSEGQVSIEMEKVLAQMPNSDGTIKAEKILQINSEHKILEKLKELFASDKEMLAKYAYVLYNQARLMEGLQVEDVNKFTLYLGEIL